MRAAIPSLERLADALVLARSHRIINRSGRVGTYSYSYSVHGAGCRFGSDDGIEVDADFAPDGREIFDFWRLRWYGLSLPGPLDVTDQDLRTAVRFLQPLLTEVRSGWFTRSTGEGPTWPPFQRADVRSVHGAVVQVQQAGAAKLGQQGGVQVRPDTSLGPVPRSAPGRHPGTAPCLRGDVTPRDTGPQRVQDAGERHSIGNTQPPRGAMAPLGGGRQQRGHPLPQVIRNKISTHAGHPADQDRRPRDPRRNSF